MTEKTTVLVIGGGYAGVMAANRLSGSDAVEVTLINTRPEFVQRLRLHQLVGGSHDAVVDYRKIVSDRVRLKIDTVDRIDARARRVKFDSGEALDYDYLVYAVGSRAAEPQVPGAGEFAWPIATLEQARQLRNRLRVTPDTAPLTVIGGGPSGIETAAELAELGRPVTLICGEVLGPYLHPRGRRSAARRLAALGVSCRDGVGAEVTEVHADSVRLRDGTVLPSAMTIWTAGFSVPGLATTSGLRTDARGRLLTDETLTSVDDDRIVGAGDAVAPSGQPLRMCSQSAFPLGKHAAETVLDRIAGRRPRALDVGLGAMCISLGRRSGVYQPARSNDQAIGLHFTGRFAAVLKEVASSGPVPMMAMEARRPGSFRWPIKDHGRRQSIQRPLDPTSIP